jgi:hypothetical protein
METIIHYGLYIIQYGTFINVLNVHNVHKFQMCVSDVMLFPDSGWQGGWQLSPGHYVLNMHVLCDVDIHVMGT